LLISWLNAAEERIFITELLSLFIGKYDQTTERKKGMKKEDEFQKEKANVIVADRWASELGSL
jgi:hypothetical protein